jgi:hypothetical protein
MRIVETPAKITRISCDGLGMTPVHVAPMDEYCKAHKDGRREKAAEFRH